MTFNLKTLAGGLVIGLGLATTAPAATATLDFLGFANGNEQGVESGTAITSSFFGGQRITFSANNGFDPYFDSGNAGLGVCKNSRSNAGLVFTGQGGSNKCFSGPNGQATAGDDNVTVTEAVTIAFDKAFEFKATEFLGASHGVISGSSNTLLFGINGGGLGRYTFAQLAARPLRA